jgi:Protein of unknown function (DUF3828)
MLTRRNFILSAACAAVAAPAFAADQSARDFVAGIYAAYKGKNSQGIVLDNAGAVRRYFAPPLAALIIKDMDEAAKRGEVGALDGDPFIDGQDWEIAPFDVAVSETVPGKARATVKFDNAGTPKTVVLDLIKIDNSWRIGEITWRRGGKDETLSSLFRSQ